MNTINEAVVALIEKAMSGIDTAVGFLQAEIPEVVHQLLVWEFVHSLLLCFIGLVLIISSVVWLYYQYKYWTGEGIDRCGNKVRRFDMEHGPLVLLNVFVPLLPLAVGFSLLNLTWLQIWVAPKVFLINYAATLIK